jgi:beta-N-acetylhexosaminidase
MEGARLIDNQRVTYTQAAVTALNAGCDMVLLCNQSVGDDKGKAVDELLEGLATALRKGQVKASQASEQRRLQLLPQTPPLDWDSLMVQPQYMHAMALLP